MSEKPRYLIDGIYAADPRGHVYNGKLYIFPSHDIESGVPENDNGDHFNMKDFHVYSLDDADNGMATDHGVALDVKDVPWGKRQMWSNDVAEKDGKYYMYFPAKDENDIFHLGVAIADNPEGPYVPQPEPMKGSFSIDISTFKQDDGTVLSYWGGIWGGQLQRWKTGKYDPNGQEPADNEPALCAKIAKMSDDMLNYGEEPKDIVVLDPKGEPLKAGDHNRRFFEAPWMHKHNGKYYFSYSTGNTHLLCYAIGDNPYGPFTYAGVILTPVVGWTTHHSIVKYKGKWYLLHHDSKPSGGKTWLRSMKIVELKYNDDGTIVTIDGMGE
ncbi:MAG: glycoside hydrolase family 43 protein [Prolixibacteraceae bacterium]|jgi:hypothetical protein|nr:glycoside hydrolase family 43 protein [Prolixibacteraceae bacterium]